MSRRVTRYTWGSGRGQEIHAEERTRLDGTATWRVGHGWGCWTRDRVGMVHEPSPSSRTEEWLHAARWTREEAMAEGPKALEFMVDEAAAAAAAETAALEAAGGGE